MDQYLRTYIYLGELHKAYPKRYPAPSLLPADVVRAVAQSWAEELPTMAPTPAKRPPPIDESQRRAEAARRAAEIAARVNRNGNAGPPDAADPNSTQGKLAAVVARINASAKTKKGAEPAAPVPAAQPTAKPSPTLAEIRARAEASRSKAGGSTPTPQPSDASARLSALDKIRARVDGAKSKSLAEKSVSPGGLSALDKIKARVDAKKTKSPAETSISPPTSRSLSADGLSPRDDAPPKRAPAPIPGTGYRTDTSLPTTESPEQLREPGRGGLGTTLHPALLARNAKAKQAQLKASQKGKEKQEVVQDEELDQLEEEKRTPLPFAEGQNPYMVDWGVYPGWHPRKPRGALSITHSMHHRPVMERENKRREAEALKSIGQDIAKETATDTEEDILLRAFTVQEPPEVEWWNDDFVGQEVDMNENINDLVTVPILIEGPRKKLERKAFVLPLTSKEYKKKRRMRRAAEHEELTQKIRLGLEPTPAPKLTKQNFMRVMPDEAIKNPTYVENLVNTQIEERKDKHEEANASRKLSKEERLAKAKTNAERNAKMGLKQMVFRILLGTELPYQMATKHKFLLQKNAEQWHDLTGVCIVGPRFSTLFIEGGEKSTRAYKHLVLDRIKWLEILANREDVPETNTNINGKGGDATIVPPHAGAKDATCKLLFEGSILKKKFKKWGGVRDATSEGQARASMEKVGVEAFFNQALAGLERDLEEREFCPYPKGSQRMLVGLWKMSC